MRRPEAGHCVRCTWVTDAESGRKTDADTIIVRLRTGLLLAVRLIDCYAAEIELEAGRAAKHYLDGMLEENDEQLWVFIPEFRDTTGDGKIDLIEVLQSLTSFTRVLGRLFIGEEEVAEILYRHRHAYRTQRELDEAIERDA